MHNKDVISEEWQNAFVGQEMLIIIDIHRLYS